MKVNEEETMEETNRRINNIEMAITELTTLNKSQEATATRQANSIDKILGYLQDLAVLKTMVSSNKHDIDRLGAKVDNMHIDIIEKEDKMQKEINHNKDELTNNGISRLIKGVIVAASISTFLFGYLYTDFHRAEKTITQFFSETTSELKQNNKRLLSIEKTMEVYKHKHNSTGNVYKYNSAGGPIIKKNY